jgi:hypothetical protein
LQIRISRWPSRLPGGIFAKLARQRLKRDIFRSVAELKQAINSFNCSNNPDRVAANLSSKQGRTAYNASVGCSVGNDRHQALAITSHDIHFDSLVHSQTRVTALGFER